MSNTPLVPDHLRSIPHLTSLVYQICHAIPYAKVTTYGHIAKLAGYPTYSRHVGNALKELPPNSTVPWHRVISSSGLIPPRASSSGLAVQLQKTRLEAEGVEVSTLAGGGVSVGVQGGGGAERVDLRVWGWFPDSL